MRLAELCRSQRDVQLLAGEWNIQDPVAGKKRLVTYLTEFLKHYARPGIMGNCIYHVKKFRNGETVLISQIDSRWVEGFQEYLLREAGVCQNSASNYERTLRTALPYYNARPHGVSAAYRSR
jgi:hypothetical protein